MDEAASLPEGQATKDATNGVPDAPRGNWVDRFAPAFSRPYLRLSRADRPIGTWLLLIPCWWGVLLAALETGGLGAIHAYVALACVPGAFLMRGAGCTWNDITDRKIDAEVARTRARPIPSGQVSVRAALVWMVAQALLALLILLTLNALAILLGTIALLPVAIYPFAKRFTWWPQVFLGIAFNWGVLLAYAACADRIGVTTIIAYAAGLVWTLFYDTIYALQDVEDDALIGVRSTARLFGGKTRLWLQGFMVGAVLLLSMATILATLPLKNPVALVLGVGAAWAFGWHLAWQLRGLDTEDAASCLKAFRANRTAGLIPVLFLAAALVL